MDDTKILHDELADLGYDEEVLKEALLNSARSTYEYNLGRMEEKEQRYTDEFAESKGKIQLPAEAFYCMLSSVVPKEDILQYRIGIDYSAGTPTVLSVISQKAKDKLVSVQNMARAMELFAFKMLSCDVNIWTITDRSLDQELINQDFPYYLVRVLNA